jgi:hypothetical protein
MEVFVIHLNLRGALAGKITYYDLAVTDSTGQLRKVRPDGGPIFEVDSPTFLPDECIQRIADDFANGITHGNVLESYFPRVSN